MFVHIPLEEVKGPEGLTFNETRFPWYVGGTTLIEDVLLKIPKEEIKAMQKRVVDAIPSIVSRGERPGRRRPCGPGLRGRHRCHHRGPSRQHQSNNHVNRGEGEKGAGNRWGEGGCLGSELSLGASKDLCLCWFSKGGDFIVDQRGWTAWDVCQNATVLIVLFIACVPSRCALGRLQIMSCCSTNCLALASQEILLPELCCRTTTCLFQEGQAFWICVLYSTVLLCYCLVLVHQCDH